jgi:thioredoxin-dependent peroxiredoxin
VLGASFNGVEQNAGFARKNDFHFPLLSDTTRAVALAYGVCSDQKARYPERMSFLIDEHGRIARVYDEVNPRDHAARILEGLLSA